MVPDCCTTIEVQGSSLSGAVFTTYTMESDLVNGHPHYTSQNGLWAMAFNLDHDEWKIQPVASR